MQADIVRKRLVPVPAESVLQSSLLRLQDRVAFMDDAVGID